MSPASDAVGPLFRSLLTNPCCWQGGDLRAALSSDVTGELRWYNRGQHIALDVARGLHYLHSHDVRLALPAL